MKAGRGAIRVLLNRKLTDEADHLARTALGIDLAQIPDFETVFVRRSPMKRFVLIFAVFALLATPAHSKEKVLLGIDVLEQENFKSLAGKKIGLVTNHTGTDRNGRTTIDVLFQAPNVRLLRLFSPEHGIRGKEKDGAVISDGKDAKTGLPIYSLYGKTNRPTKEMLQGLDALVFDIQDIGTRFYTYTTTLAYCLEEAAKRNIEFVVLDRPNPITGSITEGEVLSPEVRHFTAYLEIPTRHGLTVGEIANWVNQTKSLNAKLTVIKMKNWRRTMWWDETGLAFRPTSPNIRDLNTALLYSGVGAFEATNVSVGRGTKKPFQIFGAPWITSAEEFAERLNLANLPGFEFEAVQFKPKDDLYRGETCRGVKIKVTDREKARPIDLFINAFMILRELYPQNFEPRWTEIERVTGSGRLKKMIEMKYTAETILEVYRGKANDFVKSRKKVLLYE